MVTSDGDGSGLMRARMRAHAFFFGVRKRSSVALTTEKKGSRRVRERGTASHRRTVTHGRDSARDIEAGNVRVHAGSDAVEPAAEELPVDGVDGRVRQLNLELAGPGDRNRDVLTHELGDCGCGIAPGAVCVRPPRLHHG